MKKIIIILMFLLLMTGCSSESEKFLEEANEYFINEQYDHAAYNYGRALETDRENESAFLKLIDCYIQLEKYEKALERLEEAEQQFGSENFAEKRVIIENLFPKNKIEAVDVNKEPTLKQEEASNDEITPLPEETIAPTEEPIPTVTVTAEYTFSDVDAVMYVTADVNVRDLPSTDGEKVGRLNKGDSVEVLRQCNETGWYEFEDDGKLRYANSKYFSTEKPKAKATSTPVPTSTPTPKPKNTPKPTATATPKPTATSTPEPTATPDQLLAVEQAKIWLSTNSSYSDILECLVKYQKFSYEDALYGLSHCGADWYEEALEAANEAIEDSFYSYSRLIEKLVDEDFTFEQATYAVDNCNVDWGEEAFQDALNFGKYTVLTEDEWIAFLELEGGFTKEQAIYGAKKYLESLGSVNKYANNKVIIGSEIIFGNREIEPYLKMNMPWVVLDIVDGQALLLGNFLIKDIAYNNERTNVTWETSTVRKWLNEDFYSNVFSDKEQTCLIEHNNINEDNLDWGTDGGNNTKDKVFLLNYEEAVKYSNIYSAKAYHWWLRTPGAEQDAAAYVRKESNAITLFGHMVDATDMGVCPAIWVDIEKLNLLNVESNSDRMDKTENVNINVQPTKSQEQAVKMAKRYIDSIAFSRIGLIEQLEYEGFSKSDATYGADNCGADWYEQAVLRARSYLDSMAFSRKGLIEQLEYEGFTYDQAVYGVNKNGL